jgi:cell division protein FtsN
MKQTDETRATMNTRNIRKTCHSSRRQQGGTFLGIIVGLVVGLGIAVVVALMITKSPIPFTNGKTIRPERTPDPTADQISDPNKLLYGSKEVARQTARDQAKAGAAPGGDSPAGPAGQTSQAAGVPPVVAAIPAPVPAPKVSDTAEPKNQVSSTSTTAPKADGDDRWIYYLQAGAFREQADAENARAKLALLGMEARVSEKQSDNGSLYRVRLGPYAQLDVTNRVRAKLTENSVDAALVRVPK